MHMEDYILIEGATENNLKNLSLKIPKRQITIVTGVSGSGKSSLVLDTIAAKSRRELNDTFPSFTQQYLPKYGRPHVEKIENLPIAIVIETDEDILCTGFEARGRSNHCVSILSETACRKDQHQCQHTN